MEALVVVVEVGSSDRGGGGGTRGANTERGGACGSLTDQIMTINVAGVENQMELFNKIG